MSSVLNTMKDAWRRFDLATMGDFDGDQMVFRAKVSIWFQPEQYVGVKTSDGRFVITTVVAMTEVEGAVADARGMIDRDFYVLMKRLWEVP